MPKSFSRILALLLLVSNFITTDCPDRVAGRHPLQHLFTSQTLALPTLKAYVTAREVVDMLRAAAVSTPNQLTKSRSSGDLEVELLNLLGNSTVLRTAGDLALHLGVSEQDLKRRLMTLVRTGLVKAVPANWGLAYQLTTPPVDLYSLPEIQLLSTDLTSIGWMTAWDKQLAKSRPFWETSPYFKWPYNSGAPHVAYDPYLIPVRRAGPYLRFTLEELPESDALAVSRETAVLGAPYSNLDRERSRNLLVIDPDDPQFLVINNRWPKMPYDSLLVSKNHQPQRLTQAVILAEMHWARRGLASEFHRARQFVDDLHVHLYPQMFLPVGGCVFTFKVLGSHGAIEIGSMEYPVPHIAFSSQDPNQLAAAVFQMSEYLERNTIWFNQHMLFNMRTQAYVAYFVLWNKKAKGFGFNTTGFLKIAEDAITDAKALSKLANSWIDSETLQRIQSELWTQWRSLSIVPPLPDNRQIEKSAA